MENIQINGQRMWGPPKNWVGPPPPHGTEIFIKNIPDDIMENDLYGIFSAVGHVYEVRVPVYWNGKNRGYAFVRYTHPEEATEAIRTFHRAKIRYGCCLHVERSVDNKRLFLSAVSNTKTADELLEELRKVVENVKKVYVYPSPTDPALFRGYAFAEFVTHRDAAIAKRVLTPDLCAALFEKRCVVAWANPLPFLPENVVRQLNVIFVRNVDKNVDTGTLKRILESYAGRDSIEKIKRLNNIAFVTFRDHVSAERALLITTTNPRLLGSSNVEIEWAVPKQMSSSNSSQNSDTFISSASRSPSPINRSAVRRVTQVVGTRWQNQMNNFNFVKDLFQNGSHLTDYQKYLTDPSEKPFQTVKGLMQEIRSQNLSPADFINRRIIPFSVNSLESPASPENSDPSEGFLSGEESDETLGAGYLQEWLEKLVYRWDGRPELGKVGWSSGESEGQRSLTKGESACCTKFQKEIILNLRQNPNFTPEKR